MVKLKNMDRLMYSNEILENEEPKPRQIGRRADPVTKYDFCKIMASITKRPIGFFLKETQFWPMSWIYSIQSECKLKKTEVDKAKFINYFIKNAKLKEI